MNINPEMSDLIVFPVAIICRRCAPTNIPILSIGLMLWACTCTHESIPVPSYTMAMFSSIAVMSQLSSQLVSWDQREVLFVFELAVKIHMPYILFELLLCNKNKKITTK